MEEFATISYFFQATVRRKINLHRTCFMGAYVYVSFDKFNNYKVTKSRNFKSSLWHIRVFGLNSPIF